MKQILLLLFFLIGSLSLPNPNKVVEQLNQVRTDPISYVTVIKTKYSHYPGADEAIEFLTNTPKARALIDTQALQASAQLHANYLKGQSVIVNPHEGCNSNHIHDRITQVGSWSQVAESITYKAGSEEEIVAKLIIDSDSSNKINRRNVMSNSFTHVGVGVSNSGRYKNITVIHFAGEFSCSPCPLVPSENVEYHCTSPAYLYSAAVNISTNLLMIIIVLVGILYMF